MIKQEFQREFSQYHIEKPSMCGLGKLISPLIFSVDKICEQKEYTNKHCDEIVLCDVQHIDGNITTPSEELQKMGLMS